ncbi:MAG: flagellar biosynthesis protein FliA [Peptococcaceae bacterium BRH_c4a]|nr:MAG: flagellar biosynthesis protein FliA [Peptococcaceae bacterium BRH_c4a]
MAVEDTWKEYKRTKSDILRNQLVMQYLWMIKYLAGRLAIRLPSFMAQEDLESSGVFGLVEAVKKFDPDMGIEFEAYAYRRIRGSMIDEIRKANWMPRSTWQKLQDLKAVRERLETEGRNTEENAADELDISIKELRKLESQYHSAFAVSLDETVSAYDGDVKVGLMIQDTGSPDPFEMVAEEEGKLILAEAIGSLQEKEQLLLSLYYHEGLTLKEIGKVLEVSESRVCQLHGRAIVKLRKILQEKYS